LRIGRDLILGRTRTESPFGRRQSTDRIGCTTRRRSTKGHWRCGPVAFVNTSRSKRNLTYSRRRRSQ
ncbi:hypothetical protein FRC00_008178, partial [Tulasnella sp. 408]